MHYNRTMIANLKFAYVDRLACGWHRFSITDAEPGVSSKLYLRWKPRAIAPERKKTKYRTEKTAQPWHMKLFSLENGERRQAYLFAHDKRTNMM